MKVYNPVLWDAAPGVDYGADAIELARIVPRVGERRRAYLDKYDRIEDGQAVTFVWCPPFSDVNGWSEQPSEIAFSYIVSGTAHPKSGEATSQHIQRPDYFQHIASTHLMVEIDVHSARPLIDTLVLAEPDCEFSLPILGTHTGGAVPLWLDSEYIFSANVAGYIYLKTQIYEATLEALVRKTDNQVVLAYHHYWPPGESECFILNNHIGGDERRLFERLISIAEPIIDSHRRYLF